MKLRKVSPSKIKVPEVRIKGVFDDETKERLREAMTGMGQVAPIICVEIEGELVLVDGENRLEVAKKDNWPVIEVAVADGDMVDVLTRNLFLDHLRGKHTPGQMLRVIEELWKTYGLDSEKIAEKTGLKRDYVEKFQLLSKLTPLVRLALDEERIKLGHAIALAKITDPIRQETVLQQELLYNWSVRELEEFITQVLAESNMQVQPPAPGAPPVPVTIKCFYCGGDFTPDLIRNPNTCSDCASVLIQSIALARAELATETKPAEETPPPPK